MALSPIMLTAWAVGEIPGLEIDGYRDVSTPDYDRVLTRTTDDRIIAITSPRTAEFAKTQDAEHRVGHLLGVGVRSRLPFAVPHTLAAGTIDRHRIVATEDVHGASLATVKDVRPLLPSLGAAIAAIHNLPTSIVTHGVIPVTTSLDCLRDAAGIIDRAHRTTRVPSALLDRWDAAVEDHEMWQFAPTITHGTMDFEAVVVDDAGVSGIVNWSGATVGDPADDLKTIIGSVAPIMVEEFMDAYLVARPSNDRRLAHRARFLSELEIARWLLHGTDTNDEGIVEDGVGLLASLLAEVEANPGIDLGAPKKVPSTLVFSDLVAPPVAVQPESPFDTPTTYSPDTQPL